MKTVNATTYIIDDISDIQQPTRIGGLDMSEEYRV